MTFPLNPHAAQHTAPTAPRLTTKRKCETDGLRMWSEASNSPNPKSFPDEDPPFFLRHASSSSATDIAANATKYADNSNSGWGDPPKGIMPAEADSTVRSIIDDLTVDNKMLRARIKSLERREKYYKEIDKNKLFEIVLFNISSSDARDLEDILTAFVHSRKVLRDKPMLQPLSEENINSQLAQMPGHMSPNAAKNSTHESGASSNRLDSGYASMSMTPGPGSMPFSNNTGQRKEANPVRAANQSHLFDVPRGLFPRQSRVTNERSKKKLVVQRLEELFTGKKLLLSRSHNQTPHHSNNVSGLVGQGIKSSATEGAREANIMTHGDSKDRSTIYGEQQETESGPDGGMDSDKSCEQRPTRPFDLDPERQQIPAENVDYMRHLGISTPDLQREDCQEAGANAQGWVYLNLLMNMAQLHIMNVTADFVRDAVQEVSSKFHLSSDGRRLRWRGGTEPTQLSSLSGSATTGSNSSPGSQSPGETTDDLMFSSNPHQVADLPHTKPKKVIPRKSDIHDHTSVKDRRTKTDQEHHTIHYSPIFSHPSNQNNHTSDNTSDGFRAASSADVPDTSKRPLVPDLKYVPPTKKRKISNDRPRGMVFYNDASFFVDFGGAILSSKGDFRRGTCDFADYDTATRSVLGCEGARDKPESGSWSSNSQHLSTRKSWDRLLLRDSILKSPEAIASQTMDSYFDSDFDTPTKVVDTEALTPLLKFPIPMEASCLGCTSPADHFLETVTTRINLSTSLSSVRDETPALMQPGSVSESQSNHKLTQSRERHGDMDSLWQRIQARKACLHPEVEIYANKASGSDELGISEDGNVPLPIHSSTSKPLDLRPRAEYAVTREIIHTTFHQLEPSPQPPPALYLSEISVTTENETRSESKSDSLDGPDPTNPTYYQPNLMSQRRFSDWRGNVSGLSSGAGTGGLRRANIEVGNSSGDAEESSGVGEEDGDTDDSIDMLGFAREVDPNGTHLIEKEWELERARLADFESAIDDEVISLEVVGSPEGSDNASSSGGGDDDEGSVD